MDFNLGANTLTSKQPTTTIKPDIILTTPDSLIITNIAAPGRISRIDIPGVRSLNAIDSSSIVPIRKLSSSSLKFIPSSTAATQVFLATKNSTSPPSPTTSLVDPTQPTFSVKLANHYYQNSNKPDRDNQKHIIDRDKSNTDIKNVQKSNDDIHSDNIPTTNSVTLSIANRHPNQHFPNCPILISLKTIVKVGIVLIFFIDFVQFYLALHGVDNEESEIGRLERLFDEEDFRNKIIISPTKSSSDIDNDSNNINGKSKAEMKETEEDESKYNALLKIAKIHKSHALSLAIISLLALPLHIFGYVGVSKQSFSLNITYSIISAVLLLLQLKSSAKHRNGDLNWLLWIAHLVFTLLCIGYCYLLYRTKMTRIGRLGDLRNSIRRHRHPVISSTMSQSSTVPQSP